MTTLVKCHNRKKMALKVSNKFYYNLTRLSIDCLYLIPFRLI